MSGEEYRFDGLDELYEIADELPRVERQEVYAHHPDREDWEEVPYRDSLWTDDGRATGIVSSNRDFYNVIQYGDVLETVGDAVEKHGDEGFDVAGEVSVSPTGHKMSASLDFDGATVYAGERDPIDLGLKIRTGHSGFHGLKYDVGGERQVCSNGMMAFVSELGFDQSHQEPFQPALAYNAVDAVMESPERIEDRLQEARSRELVNKDEALLVLLDQGVGQYLENPVPDLLNALHSELEDEQDQPTLWDTYNAATRALTHYTGDTPGYELDQGFEQASRLLETGTGEIPDPTELGRETVERRAQRRIEQTESEQYWDGEDETLRELMETHGITA